MAAPARPVLSGIEPLCQHASRPLPTNTAIHKTHIPTAPPRPVCSFLHTPQGKERYVFFSFPHIAIDSDGKIGAIARPNRPGASAACGALIKTMLDLKEEGVDTNVSAPGSHDPLEPEYSILKSRIARRIKYEKGDVSGMTLVDITKVAERVITTVSSAFCGWVGVGEGGQCDA